MWKVNNIAQFCFAIAISSLVAACASTGTGTTGVGDQSTTFNVAQSVFYPEKHAGITYFQFDSASLVPQAKRTLNAQAKDLLAHKIKKIWIYGYADLRGTEDYNIALGARRAKSVSSYLRAKGVHASVLLKSYGKSLKHQYNSSDVSDQGYALNRRVISCSDQKECTDLEKNPLK